MNRDLRETCPSCASLRVASIFYGLPEDISALKPLIDAGTIILGGCSIDFRSPAFHCCLCHHEWGIAPEAVASEHRYIQTLAERAVAIEQADQRGILISQVNKNGYCKCPHCGRSFSTRYQMSWDGVRHTSCLGRVDLLPFRESAPEHT